MLNISGINNGVVLDHIQAGKSMDIYHYLNLQELDCQVAIIKNARSSKMRNLQQAELAEMVGVRRETIGKLENGKYNPSLKLAIDIARVFGKPVEEIFIFEEDEDDEPD